MFLISINCLPILPQVTLSSSALGSIMGIQSAEIQQMAMEYEEKVTAMFLCLLITSLYIN